MAIKTCARPDCDKKFDNRKKWRKRYCSPQCSFAAHREQIQLAKSNKQREREQNPVVCWICSQPIPSPKRSNQKYCGEGCAAQGVIRAIQRQADRRRALKSTR